MSRERWEAVLAALERNRGTSRGRPPAEGRPEAMLKGLCKCAKCPYAVTIVHRDTPAGPRRWYGCSNRDRVNGKSKCAAARWIKADLLENAIFQGIISALTTELDSLIAQHRAAIVNTIDAEELEQARKEERRLVRKMQEAIDCKLKADDKDEKAAYSNHVEGFKDQLRLLRRRIDSYTTEAESINVDTETIKRRILLGAQTTVPAERRAIILDWVHEIHYAQNRAVITLRIPTAKVLNDVTHVGAYRQLTPSDLDGYIFLKKEVLAA